ncbi:MAG: 6-phosphogluconolactonase [Gammaproteobacteria bacterium]
MRIAQVITQALSDTIAQNGHGRIAFPGGRSAVELMSELSHASIDWSSVCVTLVDERAVDESSDASNAALVKTTLCQNRAETATFEPMFVADDAEQSADQLNQKDSSLDIAVIGMGDDGHFASLFPNEIAVPGLADGRLGFVATSAIGSPSVPRISMTLSQILSAQLVVLLVSSDAKKDKVIDGLGSVDSMNPVSYLLASDHPILVVWPDGEMVTLHNGDVYES